MSFIHNSTLFVDNEIGANFRKRGKAIWVGRVRGNFIYRKPVAPKKELKNNHNKLFSL